MVKTERSQKIDKPRDMSMRVNLSKGYHSFVRRSIMFGTQPLISNAFALIINNLVTAIVSYIFWIIAARRFGDINVGLASATFSSMMVLDLVTNLGLSTGLIKYLGSGGEFEKRLLINTAISIRVVLGVIISLIFVTGTSIWAPELCILKNSSNLILFSSLIIFNSLFTLLSGVLVAIRNASFIVFISLTFNFLKLSIIALVPTVYGLSGIIFALFFALLVTIVIEIMVLLPMVYPGYSFAFSFKLPQLFSFFSYSFANQVADTFLTLPQFILPIIVLNKLGPELNAYFYTTMMTTGILRTALLSIAQSTFAESVVDGNQQFIYSFMKKSLMMSLVIILIGGSLLFFLSPFLLNMFGKQYFVVGKEIYLLLLLASVPFSLVNLLITIYRVKKQLKTIMIISVLWAFTSMFGAYLGILTKTLIGLVSGWVVAQVLAGIALFIYFLVINLPPSRPEAKQQ